MPYSCNEAHQDIENFRWHKLGDEKEEIEGFKRAHIHAIGKEYSEKLYCPKCWAKIKETKKHICDK